MTRRKVFSTVFALGIVLALFFGGFFLYAYAFLKPHITVDLGEVSGEISGGASGYLYGIAERGVPSEGMTTSVNITSAVCKVIGGLQHPIGDIDHVSTQLKDAEYIIIYLQDAYDTWYYKNDEIEEQRIAGTYDYEEFIVNDYFPRIAEAVNAMKDKPYADKLVYCLYNEPDNGVWFGEWNKNKGKSVFSDVGMQEFLNAWKKTYRYIKAIDPNARIGGPGFMKYKEDRIEEFLVYCLANTVTPDVMIYHELGTRSLYYWQQNLESYRRTETKLGIDALPINISEYGRMSDNGLPGVMLKFVAHTEASDVLACNAYWRLANNLCDVAADDNSPNSNWWLYYWYANLAGEKVKVTTPSIFTGNLGYTLRSFRGIQEKNLAGLATYDEETNTASLIVGGANGNGKVNLKNIKTTGLYGKRVKITIEQAAYKGLSGYVYSTDTVKSYITTLSKNNHAIKVNNMDDASVYCITITETEEPEGLLLDQIVYSRFEFEEGKLMGGAYTYKSAYASTGKKQGLVSGIEKEGDGVSLKISVPEEGKYELGIIYGKGNDGALPNDRVDALVNVVIGEQHFIVPFANTIKNEFTNYYPLLVSLTKGRHTLTITYHTGGIALDSLLVSKYMGSGDAVVLPDKNQSSSEIKTVLVLAPENGYYDVNFNMENEINFILDGIFARTSEDGIAVVYLRKGLNYIKVSANLDVHLIATKAKKKGAIYEVSASDAVLSGSATLEYNSYLDISYIDGISSLGGGAEFTVTVAKAGVYRLTMTYANNEEGGYHEYNVDLVERYITLAINGGMEENYYCRNTYSLDTYKTVTLNVTLEEGENILIFTNNGAENFNGNITHAPLLSRFILNSVIV